ncbi:hypothetical protein Q4S45_02240 [Massilia sp. R2A-15]|uniref:hypothetical protein n=1 Tax=Massilia sp. R2A-15 TaxID=3064278 RepID=UPI002733D1C0|nr:hypothetical protein [Massilia sp. R2A-15]WLI89965.1 hypothetical protein Q4S45_02240 [Massilia sp. R2A-15]
MRNEYLDAAKRGFFGSFLIAAEVLAFLPKLVAKLYRKLRDARPVADGKHKPSEAPGPN